MNEAPLVSFITVNYNGLKDTCELIESLQRTVHSVTYEVIVVDNASRKNEAEIIEKKYAVQPTMPLIKTIRSEHNRGFSAGNNLGIRKAEGKYLFFINNDTYLEEDGLQHLIDRIESHANIGAVSPKIRFSSPPKFIQYAGYTPLTSITIRNKPIGCGHKDDGTFDIAHPTPYLHGAAMMINRELLNSVGFMPENFFLYYEELDWSTQMILQGFDLWYEPGCTVFHKESQSTGQQSPLRTHYLTRNRLLYAYRNRKGVTRWLSLAYQLTIAAGKNSVQFLLNKRPDLAAAVWQGVGSFLALRPKID